MSDKYIMTDRPSLSILERTDSGSYLPLCNFLGYQSTAKDICRKILDFLNSESSEAQDIEPDVLAIGETDYVDISGYRFKITRISDNEFVLSNGNMNPQLYDSYEIAYRAAEKISDAWNSVDSAPLWREAVSDPESVDHDSAITHQP